MGFSVKCDLPVTNNIEKGNDFNGNRRENRQRIQYCLKVLSYYYYFFKK